MVTIFLFLRKKVKGPQPSVRKRKRTIPEKGTVDMSTRFYHKVLAIDLVGGSLFIAGGILLLLGLNWGSTTSSVLSDELGDLTNSGWSTPRVIASLIVGSFLMGLTVLWEYTIERYDEVDREVPTVLLNAEPILPIPVLKNWQTIICNFVTMTSGMVMFVFFYFVAIFFTVCPRLHHDISQSTHFLKIVSGQNPKQAGGQLVFFAPGVVRTYFHTVKFT
jgi:hypothetical protein